MASIVSAVFLLFLPYYLSQESYIPKANAAWGYASPNTLATWVVLGAALVLLVFSTLAFTWLGLKQKREGSMWATRPWFTPRARTKREKTAFKMSGVANAVMLSAFLGVSALTSPNLWTADANALSFIVLVVFLSLTNLALYLYSKKPTTNEKQNNESKKADRKAYSRLAP